MKKQAYVQDFYWKTITLKSVNIIECMKISETIYEGVLQTSY